MQKNNIRILVQDKVESAMDFAESLERFCFSLSIEYKAKIQTAPICFLTSDMAGRQTATIQFMTEEKTEVNTAIFNGYHLRESYEKYEMHGNKTENVKDFLDFLLKETFPSHKHNFQ